MRDSKSRELYKLVRVRIPPLALRLTQCKHELTSSAHRTIMSLEQMSEPSGERTGPEVSPRDFALKYWQTSERHDDQALGGRMYSLPSSMNEPAEIFTAFMNMGQIDTMRIYAQKHVPNGNLEKSFVFEGFAKAAEKRAQELAAGQSRSIIEAFQTPEEYNKLAEGFRALAAEEKPQA